MEASEVLDAIGGLVSQVKAFSTKLPAVVSMSVVQGGMKPTLEAVEAYEKTVSRFRDQSGASVYRRLNDPLVDSLEAFEGGKLLSAVQPLLAVLDHLAQMQRDREITVGPAEDKRMGEYRATLNKILPGSQPELEGAGRGM
ncbi:MAG: hypothetical protein ACT4OO_03110 [Nitrospiraceae bacterium]